MAYRWKPNATQRKAFAEKMKDEDERKAYEERKFQKRLYENWKDKDFIPTKEQNDFCFENIGKVCDEQLNAFNMVTYGYGCQEKVSHEYIHVVNQLRRKEIEFNNFKKTVIIMASNKKEAKEIAIKEYGGYATYSKPYKYASKGNNFYEFDLKN